MKSILFILIYIAISTVTSNAQTNSFNVTFPTGFLIGDYVEFAKLNPIDAGSSGYYEVTMSYTKGYIAASSTHIVSVGHSNPNIWREAGKINVNPYLNSDVINFTIDCNTEKNNNRLRVRTIATYGAEGPITVHIKIRAVGNDAGISAMEVRGNEGSAVGLLPMTDEWNLIVGNNNKIDAGIMAIKVQGNGNVGIGTATPKDRLSVNGKIRAQEIKVETSNWPDFVFENDYKLRSLEELETYIRANKHLPNIPTAYANEQYGIDLGEMNKLLTQKIEELTLYLIEKDKALKELEKRIERLEK